MAKSGRPLPSSPMLVLALLAPFGAAQEEVRPAAQRDDPGAAAPGIFEVAMPEFSKTLPAYYVLFVPDDYRADRAWPLIVDLHGASHPERKPAAHTVEQVWSKVGQKRGYLVAAPQCRTRSWGYSGKYRGESDCEHGGTGADSDVRYVTSVLDDVATRYAIDPKRVLLAGFSSGADFIWRSRLVASGRFAACLPICCGPPSMVRNIPEEMKSFPVYSVTGSLDVRRDGPWEGFLKLRSSGGQTLFREVPELAHRFPPLAEYELFLDWFERLGVQLPPDQLVALATAAMERKDYFLAIDCLNRAVDAHGRDGEPAAIAAQRKTLSALGEAAIERAEAEYRSGEYVSARESMKTVERQFFGLPVGAQAARRCAELVEDPKVLAEIAVKRAERAAASRQARLQKFLGVTVAQDQVDGAALAKVHPGTAAAAAGLRPGDIVVTLGGVTVDKPGELVAALSGKRPGETVAVELLRDGKKLTLDLTFLPRTRR